MSFPRIIKEKDATQIKIGKRYLVERYELMLDKMKCVGCGQCSIVCPKEAIILCNPKTLLARKSENLAQEVVDTIDEEKCVFCGNCSYFCPFDAIHLIENGEKIKKEDLVIVKEKALPDLIRNPVKCSQVETDAFVYWEGKITQKYPMNESDEERKKVYEESCPGECRGCEIICPTDAVRIKSIGDTLSSKQSPVEIDDCLCIKCGACAFICPEEIIDVKWKELHTEGPYNKIFLDPIKERLMKQQAIIKDEEDDLLY